ncbi:hypothetical protein LOCC1_G006859 [Lachnellula occidentalis]|uniref:Rhodopsin domain-containing protein n=1 Tax=Lachnellula occidentalis TaxID=215460 RepID=A0A8H8RKR1_9HELO|nr:hypothetical protein LOCC1_G006859 [Lachnellula occidentalis]
MQDHAQQLLAVTVILLVAALVTVGLRCFVRIKLVKAFGIDDYLIVVSLLVFATFCCFQLIGIHYGMGSHNRDLTPASIMKALKYQYLCELCYVLDAVIIKLSIGFLLLRIIPESAKVYRYILYVSMSIMSIWTIVIFFYVLFQCRPISYTWDTRSGKGKCISAEQIAEASYSFSAMDIVFDWLFALLPVPMLWNVKMSIQVKVSLFAILGLGIFASIATIVRLQYVVAWADVDDLLYTLAEVLVWTTVETGIGIIAASVATLRPLVGHFRIHGFSNSGSQDRSNRPTVRSGYFQSYDLGYIHNTATAGQTTTTTTHGHTMSDGHTSVESILDHGKGDKGISKRTDVQVSYEVRDLEEGK